MDLNLFLIIVSDRVYSGLKKDETKDRVLKWSEENRIRFIGYETVPDEESHIQRSLNSAIANTDINCIITSGGTGFSVRDVTPEATLPLLEKLTPGIDEYLRREGTKETPFAVLSRAISGIVKNKIVINLPGNPRAVTSSLNILKDILFHALSTMSEDAQDAGHNYDGSMS